MEPVVAAQQMLAEQMRAIMAEMRETRETLARMAPAAAGAAEAPRQREGAGGPALQRPEVEVDFDADAGQKGTDDERETDSDEDLMQMESVDKRTALARKNRRKARGIVDTFAGNVDVDPSFAEFAPRNELTRRELFMVVDSSASDFANGFHAPARFTMRMISSAIFYGERAGAVMALIHDRIKDKGCIAEANALSALWEGFFTLGVREAALNALQMQMAVAARRFDEADAMARFAEGIEKPVAAKSALELMMSKQARAQLQKVKKQVVNTSSHQRTGQRSGEDRPTTTTSSRFRPARVRSYGKQADRGQQSVPPGSGAPAAAGSRA